MSETLEVLNRRWNSTCRVLFGEEVGQLEKFAPWLSDIGERLVHRASSVSGKEVTFAITDYAEGSKWIGFEEIDFGKKAEPLPAGKAESIGALVNSLRGRFYYAGNTVLGNSRFVEKSSNITDCFYLRECGRLTECKYSAYSILGRSGEDCFGVNGIGETSFSVKCCETYRDIRSFELWQSRSCSDCFYSHNLDDCSECFFCFNAKNLRHAIGNTELPKEKYFEAKKRLQAEMAQMLKKEARLPSLVEIVSKCKKPKPAAASAFGAGEEKGDMTAIEKAFAQTSSILLGVPLSGGIDAYRGWLSKRIRKMGEHKSALSGKAVQLCDYCRYGELPLDRLISREEAIGFGERMKIAQGGAGGISLANAHEKLGGIAYFCPEYRDGNNANIMKAATSGDSANCYASSAIVYAKNCGYCFWPRSSDHCFGCAALLSSEFCMNCANSVKLSRCLEVDFSRSSSDCYFCHNIENCTDCMFCFNAKNLRYAIGNVEVRREKYMEMKKMLLLWMNGQLKGKKELSFGINTIGSKK